MPTIKRIKFRESFAKEVLDYLLLEFGESPNDPQALRLSDLEYVGEHLHEGTYTHFWSYPSGPRRSWATVQPHGRTYVISTCTTAPGKTPDPVPSAETDFSPTPQSRDDREFRRLLDRANKWQESQLKKLRTRPFAELASLPQRTQLVPPTNLTEFKFIISREKGEGAAIVIAVQRIGGQFGVDEWRQGPWFEILPTGRVIDEA